MADSPMFKLRAKLELQLDEKHDATAKRQFCGNASLEKDIERHVLWSERRKGGPVTAAEKADLVQMLSLRGLLPAPLYTDKPSRMAPSKEGGGRNKRRTMRGSIEKAEVEDVEMQGFPAEDYDEEEERKHQERLKDDAAFEAYRKQMAEEQRKQATGALHFTDYMSPEDIEEMLLEAEQERLEKEMYSWN